MYCPTCNTPNPSEYSFCSSCGGDLTNGSLFGQPTVIRPRVRRRYPVKLISSIVAGGTFVLIVGLVAFWFGRSSVDIGSAYDTDRGQGKGPAASPQDQNTNSNNINAAIANAVKQTKKHLNEIANQTEIVPKASEVPTQNPTQTYAIFQGSDVLGPNRSKPFAIHITNIGRVSGRFTAEGGMRGEIECFIASPDDAQNIMNGLAGKTYFNSGKVNVGNLDVTLAGGNYVLLFRNPSPWTQRIVQGHITLTNK